MTNISFDDPFDGEVQRMNYECVVQHLEEIVWQEGAALVTATKNKTLSPQQQRDTEVLETRALLVKVADEELYKKRIKEMIACLYSRMPEKKCKTPQGKTRRQRADNEEAAEQIAAEKIVQEMMEVKKEVVEVEDEDDS